MKNFMVILKWFETFKEEEYLEYSSKSINNNLTKLKQWKTSDNIIIGSIHPPKSQIDKNVNGTIVRTSP